MKCRGRKLLSPIFFAALFAAALLFSSCASGYSSAPPPEDVHEAAADSPSGLEKETIPLSPAPDADYKDAGGDIDPLSGDFTIYFLDVGQADSAVVACDEEYMLIDGGNTDDSSLIYSFLKSHDIKHLDYVIGTHAHEDHIGGIAGALNFASAGKVYCPEDTYDTKAFGNFVKAVEKQGLTLTKPEPGETFELGGASVEILAPVNFEAEDQNDLSVVLKITYGQTSFLFAADAGRNEEQDILDEGYDIDCTVLKVGHHGSESSTTYPFLREVMPEYAVISVGKDNDYGHPTDAVLSRLRDADVTMFRTDLNGTIVCTSDGETVTFEPAKGEAFIYTGEGTASSATTEPATSETSNSSAAENYLGNLNSYKFHYIDCGSGQKTLEKNRVYFATREEAVNQGFVPGKCCNP